ncbi:MAG: OstA-like protein [Melioribacteraceae bacterium]
MISKRISIVFMLIASILSAQSGEPLQITGFTFSGKIVNGESLREFEGEVVIVQGAVRITCDRAIQYVERNEAELIGKVVVTQDSIIIRTDRGYYYGNKKVAFSNSGVKLTDGHIELQSKNGYYYFDEKRSNFYGEVFLTDKLSKLKTDRLNYYDDEDKAVAVGNVQATDTASTIFADSLIHYRNTDESLAFNNIRIYNPSNRLAIFGNKLEDSGSKKYSKITDRPFLIRIDTTDAGELDTLMISAGTLESFDDSTKKLIATDSVKIVRTNFASLNEKTWYFEDGDRIETVRRESDYLPPVMWNDNTQMSADSITMLMKNNRLELINLNSNASIITADKDSVNRYDQMSGKKIRMLFNKDGLEKTEIDGNALSIYYQYEDDEPNGLIKSSAERAKIVFQNKSVSEVRFYGKPVTEFHPENIIKGKEKDFTIPTFRLYSGKPTQKELLSGRRDLLLYLMKDAEYYGGKPDSKK